jgi:predicted phosphodiesterase
MVRIIGDVHGNYQKYLEIIKESEYSIQIGDLGLNYDFFKKNNVNSNNHVFFGGNHDNYDTINSCNNNLGDFGFKQLGDFKFFFVRGAWSIDNKLRNHFDVFAGNKKIRPKSRKVNLP